ncbi:uncharacterized protein JCM15063_005503 [Sporobolomyces koalae]|uniref:uncharacterized protein n=1 Tax=Sporobolomyces koalae TaxID=500713 RepID=UPI0031736702
MAPRSITVVALVALASRSALAADAVVGIEERSTSPATDFQLPNLARSFSFSSAVEQLKKRSGGESSSKVSRAIKKERSISDDLIALLKLAGGSYEASPSQHTAAAAGGSKPSAAWTASQNTHLASKPTGTGKKASDGTTKKKSGPSAAYHTAAAAKPTGTAHKKEDGKKTGPSAHHTETHAAAAKGPQATHKASAAYQQPAAQTLAAAPEASGAAEHNAKRGLQVTLEEVQKRIQEEPWENLDSQLLCPAGETACPIFPRMGTYECVDTMSELENCGGCASRSLGQDCTAITGALGLACQSGKCNVFTCQPGWEFSQISRDGHGACIKIKTRSSLGFFGTGSKVKRE